MTKEEFYDAAFKELQGIEKGEVTVELTAGDLLLGKVEYTTSNGWKIVVFSDGDDWDYVDSITPPSGEHVKIWPEKDEDCEEMRRLRSYHPPEDQLRKVWGFLT